MAKDDNGEESGICVRGNKEAEPKVELHKKNVWFVFVCVGACYKVDEGMDFFFFLFWWLGVKVVVGGGGSYGCGCARWWSWVLAVVVCLLAVKEMRMRLKNNKNNKILMKL